MIAWLFHRLTGFAVFTVRGDGARFLTLAAKSGVGLWGFQKLEGVPAACCRARDYKKLLPLARRCGVRLKTVEKRGLPFPMRRLRKRKGLCAGAFCGAGIFLFLSGFVWGVSVSGGVTLSDRLLLEAGARSGVYAGVPKSALFPAEAAHRLVLEAPELKWAAVNTNGCFAEILVEERAEKPELPAKGELSNIVAARPGIVLAVEAETGRPEVSVGEAVSEGDLLISGMYQEQLTPWDPRAEQPHKTAGAARGRVTAETSRSFTVAVSARKKETVFTGKRQTDLSLVLFGLRIPLGLHGPPEEICRDFTVTETASALGVRLPLALERHVWEITEERERVLTEEEMKEAALLKLRELQRTVLPPGSRVTEEELVFTAGESCCVLEALCRCREEIGALQKVLVKQPESENNF